MRRILVVAPLLLSASLTPIPAHAEVLFSIDFESGAPDYGTGYTYPEGGNFYGTQVVGQGWAGSNGFHIVTRAGQRQYNTGWSFSVAPANGWHDGDIVFVRFRVRYDDNFRWDGEGSMQNKMVDFGVDDMGSRVILHQERPHSTTACGLADSYAPDFGDFSVKKNIGEPCTPPAPITYGVWYHVQFAVQTSTSSQATDGYFELWVNNNDLANPSSETLGVTITTDTWNDSWDFGGFITDAPLRDQGYIVDDLQVATTFDPTWFPDGAPDLAPAAPTQLIVQ